MVILLVGLQISLCAMYKYCRKINTFNIEIEIYLSNMLVDSVNHSLLAWKLMSSFLFVTDNDFF